MAPEAPLRKPRLLLTPTGGEKPLGPMARTCSSIALWEGALEGGGRVGAGPGGVQETGAITSVAAAPGSRTTGWRAWSGPLEGAPPASPPRRPWGPSVPRRTAGRGRRRRRRPAAGRGAGPCTCGHSGGRRRLGGGGGGGNGGRRRGGRRGSRGFLGARAPLHPVRAEQPGPGLDPPVHPEGLLAGLAEPSHEVRLGPAAEVEDRLEERFVAKAQHLELQLGTVLRAHHLAQGVGEHLAGIRPERGDEERRAPRGRPWRGS